MSNSFHTPETIELFKIIPVPGIFYELANYTIKCGTYPDYKYYTDNPPIYVGQFVNKYLAGYRDGEYIKCYYIFHHNGVEIKVDCTDDRYICFREVSGRIFGSSGGANKITRGDESSSNRSEIGIVGPMISNMDEVTVIDEDYAVPETNEERETEPAKPEPASEVEEKYPIYKRFFCPLLCKYK